jgi:hypothetical protein
MNKIKNYGLLVLTVFVLILAWQTNHYIKKFRAEKADRERLWQNNLELTASVRKQTNLIYTKDEFIRVMTDSTAKLLKSLQIKPKTVTKIVEHSIVIRDTIVKEVPVQAIGKNQWQITDKDKCWTWQGVANLKGDSLTVKRNLFESKNKIVDIEARKVKRKFLFWNIYDKKKVELKTVTECGESSTQTISVIK